MTDLLAQATAELYAADPDEFTGRRTELAAQARDQDQPAVAKQIAALRKPTRSAWVVNQLSRTHPEAATRLADLAEDLRAGGDGARIKELTQARGRLVDELAKQAFAAAGLGSPPAALREDVVGTLNAALADPEVAAGLAAGTLTRAVHWAGFGLVPLTQTPPKPRKPAPPPAVDELSRRRGEKRISAERTVAQLTEAAESATEEERNQEESVRHLEAELEQARQRLAEARREAYRAESRRRRAAEELSRLGE